MKGNATMKKVCFFITTLIVMTLACGLFSVATTPTQASASATPIQATEAPTTQPPSSTGTEVTFGVLTLVVPSEVASGASGSEYPRVDRSDAPWWQKTPGHLQVMLGDYYVLQGKSRQPQIYMYPALDYAELVPTAFESIHRLDNILYGPAAPIDANQLPAVPFFNEAQLFASNIQVISFQNGQGIRFLTEYGQSASSANNYDLFYQFQGLTSDGAYYIVAIFPISAPVLAETSDAGAPLPTGGIPYQYMVDPNTDVQAYYTAVTNLLNSTPQDAFVPTINQLDALIQSMQITP
jgi:hypothetical protein